MTATQVKTRNQLTLTTPSDREIVMTRVFEAPRERRHQRAGGEVVAAPVPHPRRIADPDLGAITEPLAARRPVLTAAPFPIRYGWEITRQPLSWPSCAVSMRASSPLRKTSPRSCCKRTRP